MKLLYKSAVTLTFLTIISIVVSILFSAMRKLHIESWFFFNSSVMIGFLSGLMLTSLISLINFHQLQRSNAKEITAELSDFKKESDAFLRLTRDLPNDHGTFVIPEQNHQELELALAHLDDRSNKIMRCERISPLKAASIRKLRKVASTLAKSELAFYQAYSPFAESCNMAYHVHNVLPYLKDEVELQEAQSKFNQNLQQIFAALEPESTLAMVMRQYQDQIGKFLGTKRAKEAI